MPNMSQRVESIGRRTWALHLNCGRDLSPEEIVADPSRSRGGPASSRTRRGDRRGAAHGGPTQRRCDQE